MFTEYTTDSDGDEIVLNRLTRLYVIAGEPGLHSSGTISVLWRRRQAFYVSDSSSIEETSQPHRIKIAST